MQVSRKKYKMLIASRAELITELESLRLPRDRFYGPKPPQFLHFLVQKGCSKYAAEREEVEQPKSGWDLQMPSHQ